MTTFGSETNFTIVAVMPVFNGAAGGHDGIVFIILSASACQRDLAVLTA